MVVGSQGSRVKVWMIATQTWIVDISSDKYGSSKMPLPLGLPPTLPRAASIHSSLDQKRSCSDCFSVSTDDDPAQPATEISLTSTSWSSSPKPTFSQISTHCTMSDKGRGREKDIGGGGQSGSWQQQPPQ
jgi:hypothetical protein